MTQTEERIQLALTSRVKSKFYARRWTCVPNVTGWGMPTVISTNREVDLLCVSQSRWAHAVEVKISLSDLKADKKKRWRVAGSLRPCPILCEWFAVPETLASAALDLAPATAGVIALVEHEGRPLPHNVVLRDPVDNADARKLTDEEFLLLLRLGVMRMWARRGSAK